MSVPPGDHCTLGLSLIERVFQRRPSFLCLAGSVAAIFSLFVWLGARLTCFVCLSGCERGSLLFYLCLVDRVVAIFSFFVRLGARRPSFLSLSGCERGGHIFFVWLAWSAAAIFSVFVFASFHFWFAFTLVLDIEAGLQGRLAAERFLHPPACFDRIDHSRCTGGNPMLSK